MQATLATFADLDNIPSEADQPAPSKAHPWAKLGKAPFACVDISFGDTRCAYCNTRLKNLFHIRDANGGTFIVGSECVRQCDGAVADFDKFNRMMQGRLAELRATAKAAKVAAEATAWKAAHPAEWAYMQTRAQSSSFYAYQVSNVDRYGSIFAHNLANIQRDMQQAAERAKPAVTTPQRAAPADIDLSPVATAFGKAAAAGIKWPKLRLAGFVFSLAGAESANAGAIYIKTRQPAGDLPGTYLGKVMGGKLFTSRECDEAAKAEILAVSQDPKAAAVAYGRAFGRCSVCNRELTDAASVEAGIGPVCAKRYGWEL